MNLRITSDGTPEGTKLFDIRTGRELSLGISKLTWSIEPGNIATATLVALFPQAYIDGVAQVQFTDPRDGVVKIIKALTLDDGSVYEFE